MKANKKKFLFRIIYFLFCFLLCAESYSQKSKFIIAVVKKIDTVILVDTPHLQLAITPNLQEKVQVVYLDIKNKPDKKGKKIQPILITKMVISDHICPFNFKVGETYKIPFGLSRYTSHIIISKYRKWHYTTRCNEMPSKI